MDLQKDPYRNYMVKPVTAGAIAAAAAMAWRGNVDVDIPGIGLYPLPVVAGVATFVGSQMTSLINDYLFPHIPVVSVLQYPAHAALNVAANVATTRTIENYLSPGLVSDLPLTEVTAFCAVAEMGASYLTDNI